MLDTKKKAAKKIANCTEIRKIAFDELAGEPGAQKACSIDFMVAAFCRNDSCTRMAGRYGRVYCQSQKTHDWSGFQVT